MMARLLIMSLILIGSPALAQANPVAGEVKSLRGEATLIMDQGHSEKIRVGAWVPSGSRIETADDGRVVIEWLPGAYSAIERSSNVAVLSLDYGKTAEGAPKRRISLNLLNGTIFSHLIHNDGMSNFSVKTPEGVATAWGTDWAVALHGHTVQVATFTNTVTFILSSGKIIGVKADEVYNLGEDKAGPMKQAQLEAFMEMLKDVGFNMTQLGQDVYMITYTSSDGETGFISIINPPLAEQGRNESDHTPLGESPVPSSKFIPPSELTPPVGPTSP